jgi:ABC-type multidrug transport system ATPase subunit
MQSETLLESLTTRENLWFSAELRLSNAFDQAHKLRIVRDTLKELDLDFVADKRVSVLSGGQKRRITVGVVRLLAEVCLIIAVLTFEQNIQGIGCKTKSGVFGRTNLWT